MSDGNPVVPGGFAPGSRIAGYLLEEQIGQGGMAVVFRAHDERLDRTVALKILAPALAADEAFRQRFIRESRAAAAVDDPHIIPVFEAGEASGVLFIAMRFVRGGDVRSLVSQFGPLPPGRVAEIVSQVASALDAAHGRGLVHRDVKPANMLLDASGGAGRPDHVYLSDFGLSKGSLQASGLTGTGTFLGTLDYISPEQIEGKPVDGRADEYALACAAFELLTGVPPFQRDEAMAVMYAQLSEPPPQLTSRRGDLPTAADAVFARALAKLPAERYGNCREFSDALREAFGIRPYDSGPGSVPSGEHPATQVVRQQAPSGPSGGGTQLAGGAPPGMGSPVGAGAAGAGAAGSGGGYGGNGGAAATQIAGGVHGSTSPDLTAAHWQQGGPGDYQVGRARPWWRSPIALIALVVVLIGGGGAAYFLTKGSAGSPPPPHHQVALTAPGPGTVAASGKPIAISASLTTLIDKNPFGVAASPDGKFVFVATDSYLEVFSAKPNGKLQYDSHYQVAPNPNQPATAVTLTSNGRYLLVAAGNGAVVLDAGLAESGAQSAQVGSLTVPGITGHGGYGRAVDVAITPDDKFAFVALQFASQVGVFSLGDAASTGSFSSASYVGSLNVPQADGVTVSPDGKWLYSTSFLTDGTVNAVSIASATSNPKSATMASAKAGANPARIVADGGTLWVTARQSNYVLGYSAAKLTGGQPDKALIARVQVGQQPIGEMLVSGAGGSRLIIANTAGRNLAVVDTAAALAGKPALLGYISSGGGPHELALSPDKRFLYVTNRDSSQLQVVDLSKLP
ncbi:MAG TPA: protein kinase [Streptosporangiaceae bacterium]